jgi:hypothetical protein
MTVAEIEAMDRTALLAAWAGIFGAPAPKSLSQGFLRRFLAFEVQARQQGGMPASLRKRLDAAAAKRAPEKRPGLRPGARLIREWNGVSHVVDVVENGYLWRGARCRSLTAIAREITGAHWSGPRFFGLGGKDRP